MIALFKSLFAPIITYAVELNPDSLNPMTPVSDMPTFISDFFPMMVKIIAAIAVLSIAFWGIRYMYSNVPGMEKVSKDRIWGALLGLLLALSSYMILNIINPNIITSVECFVNSSAPGCPDWQQNVYPAH